MAEPPRRTLLAKLRGKKCKKGASTGGRDAAVGGGEGKEKVCRARDTRARRAAVVPVPELECMSDPVRGKQDYFNGGLEKRVVHVVGGEAAAVQDAFPRYGSGVHVNTHRGDARTGGGARDGAAEREDPPGVCVHGETPDGRSDRGEMKRVQERDGHFTRPGSRGDHRERRAQLVPFPRRHTGGDSIGFGTRESVPSEHRAADTGVVHLTDGQEPLEEIGTNVGYETDVGRRYRDKALHVHRAGSFIPTPDVETLDPTKLNYTGDGPAETRTCDPESPHVLHYVRNVDENELIRTIESSFQLCRDVRTPTLQSPTFFPTELEMVSTDVSPCLATRHHSVDSEDDDDYYDNEILPFYESGPHNTQPTNRKEPDETSSWQPASAQIVPSGSDANAEETDRLRIRLREAFCLLMNAMQDGRDGQDGQDVSSSCADNSVSSSRSHDSASVCSWSSSTWPAEGDVQEGSGRGYRGVGGTSRRTRSLQCLVPEGRPPLQRSVSDGGVRYPAESDGRGSLTEKESGHALQVVSMDTRDATSGGGRSFEDVGGAAGAKVAVPRHVEEEEEEETRQHGPPTCPGVPARSPAPPCVPQPSQSACGGVGKPPGLTVNKMQEWMHRGRVLSSEMRLRIAGSSPRGGQGPGAEGQVWAARPAHVCTQGAKPGSTGPAGAAQPVGVADGSSVTCRDSSSRLAALNSITVSKKRNWLHQSSARPGPPPEDATPLRTAEDERGPPPSSNTPTPSAPPEAPPPHGVRQLRPSALPVDPAEENDADDEGEIWYNPIPEEEEAAPPPCVPAPWPTPPGAGPEENGRGVPGAGGDAVSGNVVQMCRAQDENLPVQPAPAEASEQR
ncbi:uncharacterized protein LOC143505877, partial [Brachyhypopomus gauderio]|uniref:uncharacterized protein LOC143505877 n=1 Tax=Brachyhypopomus gauderio TaxID=698409 RepID=UPI0040424959